MAYEMKELSGTIFNNERKEKETHPDRTGRCLIGGRQYYISGWIKEGKNGKFLSLAFKPVEEHGQEDQTQRQPARQPQGKASPQRRYNSIPDSDPNNGREIREMQDDPNIPF